MGESSAKGSPIPKAKNKGLNRFSFSFFRIFQTVVLGENLGICQEAFFYP